MKKKCTKCQLQKEDFYKGDAECKECRRDRSRRYHKVSNRNEWRKIDRKNNPMKYREWEVKRNYGITAEQYHAILNSQDGKCAGCSTLFSETVLPFVDHDHGCCPQKRGCCGKCVRGILCHGCNLVLGASKDSAETLSRLIKYLNGEKSCE